MVNACYGDIKPHDFSGILMLMRHKIHPHVITKNIYGKYIVVEILDEGE